MNVLTINLVSSTVVFWVAARIYVNVEGTLDLLLASGLATVTDAAPYMGPAYWILLGAGAAGDVLHHVRRAGEALAAGGGFADRTAVTRPRGRARTLSGRGPGLDIDRRGAAGKGDVGIVYTQPPEAERLAPVLQAERDVEEPE